MLISLANTRRLVAKVHLALECGDCHNFRCFTSYRSYIFDFLILNSLIGALNLFKHEKLFGESKKSEIILQSKQFTKKRHMQCKF